MYTYNCMIIRVIDGDTVEALIDLGFNCHYRSPVRLKGINSPEMHGTTREAGIKAREKLTTLLAYPPIQITTEFSKDKDKYGRVLGTFINYENLNVNQAMIESGHAVAYMV